MRGAVLPDALLAAALGFAISYCPQDLARRSALLMVSVSITVAIVPLAGLSEDIAYTGCWLSVMAAAACVHLKGGPNTVIALLLAANCGVWAGLVTHVSQGAGALAYALPALLVCIPGQFMVRRGWGISIKVVASWLIAIAFLEASLNFVPTPGYKPDHMD